LELLVGIISGAIGGSLVGGSLYRLDLGLLGNTVAGVIGGGLGTHFLGHMPVAFVGSAAIADAFVHLASGALCGGTSVAIFAMIRDRI